MTTPMPEPEFRAAMDRLIDLVAATISCPCCLGDPDTVCNACGSHACWAGQFMCSDAQGAGVRQWRDGDPIEPVTSR